MNEMEKLQYVLFERLHRRAPGIDKLDRLWDAAVLLPLVRTPEGIISDENNITLDILLNKGTDSNNNIILFYNLSKIIPLKFNDLYLEDNIYSLCNYILKKELSSL